MIFFIRLIGNGDEDLAGGLLVMPAAFDGSEFGGLSLMNVVAIQVPQKQLDRNEESRKEKAHSQHQHAFYRKFSIQAVPSAARSDTEGATQIGGNQHVWKANPYDRTEDDRLPIGRDEDAVIHRVANRGLHPAIVDHDPEGAEGRTERHHHGGKQVDRWRYPASPEHQYAEE